MASRKRPRAHLLQISDRANDSGVLLVSAAPAEPALIAFLTHIAEPSCRGAHIVEYLLTANSLRAALASGTDTNTILEQLQRYSSVPEQVRDWIVSICESVDGCKLVCLAYGRWILEASPTHPFVSLPTTIDCLEPLLDSSASSAQLSAIKPGPVSVPQAAALTSRQPLFREYEYQAAVIMQPSGQTVPPGLALTALDRGESFEGLSVRHLEQTQGCDPTVPMIWLRPDAKLRAYQQAAQEAIFCMGRARSGVLQYPKSVLANLRVRHTTPRAVITQKLRFVA